MASEEEVSPDICVFVENFELQLSELEMLQGMYPKDGEFLIENPLVCEEMGQVVSGTLSRIPYRHLSYRLRISFDTTTETEMDKPDNSQSQTDDMKRQSVELICYIPFEYPHALPDVYVKCDAFSRDSQKQFNENLDAFLEEQLNGEILMLLVINWIQENGAQYIENKGKRNEVLKKTNEQTFTGMWIYSHHIYRGDLRKKIMAWAKEFGLTGFSLPGKPGIICIEGYQDDCEDYWHKLKYPNWKHISCKDRTDVELDKNSSLDDKRIFQTFEEISFEAHGDYGLRKDVHMDLGAFYQYLKEHKSEGIFQLLFGVEGRVA